MFKSEKIEEGITRILCPGNVYVYYVEGNNSGLLIDTGLGYGDLKGFVDSISTKPYDVVLTHGHLDHAGGTKSFETVYLNEKDFDMVNLHTEIPIRKGYLELNGVVVDESLMVGKREQSYSLLKPEQIFDLGDVSVQALPMPGHTNGSMAILVEPHRFVLFGDACNSLAFMQFEDCISIEEYGENLKVFKEKYESLYDTIYYSHPHNQGGKEILDEMITLCLDLVSGKIEGIPFDEHASLAMEVDVNTMLRLDGKIANVAYLKNNVRKL